MLYSDTFDKDFGV